MNNSEQSSIETIVFDLDGTLVDAFEDIRLALNHALALLEMPPLTIEQTMPIVGHGIQKLIEDAAPRPITAKELDDLAEALSDHYARGIVDNTRPYSGVEEMLTDARGRGLKLAVLSNKLDSLTRAIVDGLGLADYFDLVLGLAPGAPKKPDPASLQSVLDRLDANAETTLMVGDGETDLAVGRAVGTRTAACLYGARSREQLAPYEPDAWLDEPTDLTRWLEEFLR